MNPNGWAISLDSPEHATAGAPDHSHPWHPWQPLKQQLLLAQCCHSSEGGSTTSRQSQNCVSPVGPKLHGPLFGPQAIDEFAPLKRVDHCVTSQGN